MSPELGVAILWALWVASWIASWIAASVWRDPAARRVTPAQEAPYRVATILGALLLFLGSGALFPNPYRLWNFGWDAQWVLVVLALAGLIFTWWARIYLGRLWSSAVTKKADHRIIDTGPYAIVRHPIYTGILAAIFASAAMSGALLSLIGALVFAYAFTLKAQLEERFLREQLGAEAYDSYRRRVPMLIPFGPKSG
jgi:protein-S-isoprenylcysteine O-methyltransferase Ste14